MQKTHSAACVSTSNYNDQRKDNLQTHTYLIVNHLRGHILEYLNSSVILLSLCSKGGDLNQRLVTTAVGLLALKEVSRLHTYRS
jgi:hypothetical protein